MNIKELINNLTLPKNKELEDIILSLNANMSNNYKDNAQANLKELKLAFNKLCENGKLKNKQIEYYTDLINHYMETMQGFTHKDQKPYWDVSNPS